MVVEAVVANAPILHTVRGGATCAFCNGITNPATGSGTNPVPSSSRVVAMVLSDNGNAGNAFLSGDLCDTNKALTTFPTIDGTLIIGAPRSSASWRRVSRHTWMVTLLDETQCLLHRRIELAHRRIVVVAIVVALFVKRFAIARFVLRTRWETFTCASPRARWRPSTGLGADPVPCFCGVVAMIIDHSSELLPALPTIDRTAIIWTTSVTNVGHKPIGG